MNTPCINNQMPTDLPTVLLLGEVFGGAWTRVASYVYIRQWNNTDDEGAPQGDALTFSDTFAVTDENMCLTERLNPNGEPVWRHSGKFADIVAALRELPDPGGPGAPTEPLPRGGN
jgi:hypothetical protein